MKRLAAAILAILAILTVSPASAERRLAVGAAGGFYLPEGTRMIPVYTWPRGTRWEPADTGLGYRFREPIYTAPPGYKYVYVRGYQIIPAHKPSIHRVHRVKASVVRVKKARRAPCVTDIGNGRYELCF